MHFTWAAVQAVADIGLVLTSGGAISYAALQLRHEREYRAVTNLETQLSFFVNESFVAARWRLAEVRLAGDGLAEWSLREPPIEAFEVLDFYDHLGLLVKKGHLEVEDVWQTFYEWAQPVYVDMQKLIEDPQSEYADHYADLRGLMRAMDDIQLQRMHKKDANHWALWTPARIHDYYRYEFEMGKSRRDRSPRMRRGSRRGADERRALVLDAEGNEIKETETQDA
jgi:hypothetical protein